LTPALT